jgi:hypothetical protein
MIRVFRIPHGRRIFSIVVSMSIQSRCDVRIWIRRITYQRPRHSNISSIRSVVANVRISRAINHALIGISWLAGHLIVERSRATPRIGAPTASKNISDHVAGITAKRLTWVSPLRAIIQLMGGYVGFRISVPRQSDALYRVAKG